MQLRGAANTMNELIHPTAIVDPGAVLGPDVRIGPYSIVGADVDIGAGSVLHAHAVVMGNTRLGSNCVVHSHAVIGNSAQVLGLSPSPDAKVVIGDNCVFREFTSVHAGNPKASGLTTIGNNCFMMVGTHVAHDCRIGDNVVMANYASLAGHLEVGDNVWFGGSCAVHQFTRIGRHAFVGGGAILVEDVIPFGSVIGNRAHLAGLNVVGLKRRGFSKSDIQEIREAYRAIFESDGLFSAKVEATAVAFAERPLGREIVTFIQEGGSRPICKPG